MDAARHQLLPRPTLALDEHRHVRLRHSLHLAEERPHCRALPQHPRRLPPRQLVLELGQPRHQATVPDGVTQRRQKVDSIDRFRQVVERARLNRRHGLLHFGVRRQDQDRHAWVMLEDPRECLRATHPG